MWYKLKVRATYDYFVNADNMADAEEKALDELQDANALLSDDLLDVEVVDVEVDEGREEAEHEKHFDDFLCY